MTQFMAMKDEHSDKWRVIQEIVCINGLAAWFTVAYIPEADESEMGYSDGAIGTAEQRANEITDMMNNQVELMERLAKRIATSCQVVEETFVNQSNRDIGGAFQHGRMFQAKQTRVEVEALSARPFSVSRELRRFMVKTPGRMNDEASAFTGVGRRPMTTDEMIDRLTDGEGDTLTFCSRNADFNGLPNDCVTVNASWTDWQDRDFRADTRADCLRMAFDAMRGAALTATSPMGTCNERD